MNILAIAAHHGSSSAGPIVWIVLVGSVLVLLLAFGWRPLRSRPVRQSPAAAATRATGRAARRVRQQPQAQPDDAA